jgi:MarR family transcriptional regulator, transcriptional regulator for hemolysin
MEWPMPRTGEINVDFLFALFELQRMLRLYADKQARRFGLTRAQWAVLAKLERIEGLKQTEIADLMEMQPITLTRLIDKLCDAGLIERRSDETDRRVNRLYLTEAAKPLMAKLATLRAEITQTALASLSNADTHRLVDELETIKDNIREALLSAAPAPTIKEPRYG